MGVWSTDSLDLYRSVIIGNGIFGCFRQCTGNEARKSNDGIVFYIALLVYKAYGDRIMSSTQNILPSPRYYFALSNGNTAAACKETGPISPEG